MTVVDAASEAETAPPDSEDRRWLLGASVLVAVVAGTIWLLQFWGMIYDDSYIIYRYAGRLADGNGLRWNVGGDWQFGSTSLIWAVIGGIADAIGVRPEVAMPLVGAAAWVALVVGVAPRLLSRVSDDRRLVLAGVVAIAAIPSLGFHTLTGLETAAAALIAAAALHAALARRWRDLAILSVVGVITRPDLLVVLALLWGLSLLFAGWPPNRRILGAGLSAAAAICVVGLVCFALFDTPVPNSFYVKSDPGRRGLEYILEVVPLVAPLMLPVVVALVFALRATIADRALWLAGLPAVVFVASYVRVDPLLGQQHRFFVPVLPLFVVAAVRGAQLVPRRWLGLGALAVALVASMAFQVRSIQEERPALDDYFGAIEQTLVPLGKALAEADGTATLATAEAGAMPYYSDLTTLDLIGLNELTIARNGLNEDTMRPERPTILALQDVFVTDEPGPHVVVEDGDGGPVYLDDEAYRGARPYTGRSTSRFVLQREGFAQDYRHVASIGFGTTDRFEIFVLADAWEANRDMVEAVRGLPTASLEVGGP